MRRRILAALAATSLLIGGCGDGTDGIRSTDGPITEPGTAADAEDETVGEPRDGELTDGDVVDPADPTPGMWEVGEAGTVTWNVFDGRLDLVTVTPADGWEVTTEAVDDDEIEVELERDDESYDFFVELDGDASRFELTIQHEREDDSSGEPDVEVTGRL